MQAYEFSVESLSHSFSAASSPQEQAEQPHLMDQDVWEESSRIIQSNAEEAFHSISKDSARGQQYHTTPSKVPYGAQDPNNNDDHNTAEADIPVASGSLPPEPSGSGRDPLRSDAGPCMPSVARIRELELQIARKMAQNVRERADLAIEAYNVDIAAIGAETALLDARSHARSIARSRVHAGTHEQRQADEQQPPNQENPRDRPTIAPLLETPQTTAARAEPSAAHCIPTPGKGRSGISPEPGLRGQWLRKPESHVRRTAETRNDSVGQLLTSNPSDSTCKLSSSACEGAMCGPSIK